MAKLLKGAVVTAALNEKIKSEVKRLSDLGIYPTLAMIRVGEREDDIYYERNIMKCCTASGINAKCVLLDNSAACMEST